MVSKKLHQKPLKTKFLGFFCKISYDGLPRIRLYKVLY